jgi:hypothetical protein
MKSAIEFHDSECLAIEKDFHGNGAVILDAYVHRTDGDPGVSPGEGGTQRARFSFESITIDGEIGPLPAIIYGGSLMFGGACFDYLVPVPSDFSGNVSLTLELLYDSRSVTIAGKNVSIRPEEEFRFVEAVNPD